MIEEVIREALVESESFGCLASYGGLPAVFYGEAANDADPNWDTDKQFPRSVFMVNWSFEAERTRAGTLIVDILCRNNEAIDPSDVADALTIELSNLFFTDENETCSVLWKTSSPFREGTEPEMIGVSVVFDIVSYPIQQSDSPKVVESFMDWITDTFTSIHVIGVNSLERIWRATDENPACYVRMNGISSPTRPTHACCWMTCTINIHIICGGIAARQTWIRRITDKLAIEGEIILDDDSPFFVHQLKVTSGANPVTVGQIAVSGEFGVLRVEAPAPKVQHVIFDDRLKEGESNGQET